MLKVRTKSGSIYKIDLDGQKIQRIREDRVSEWRFFEDIMDITVGRTLIFKLADGSVHISTLVEEIIDEGE